jgi:hypothetical protein
MRKRRHKAGVDGCFEEAAHDRAGSCEWAGVKALLSA